MKLCPAFGHVVVALPAGSNEARLIDQVDSTLTKVLDLGFVRRLKPAAASAPDRGHYEVRRILKAFVDAQWLAQFDARLAQYQAQLILPPTNTGDAHE